ncbi:hypothetical protein PybrP1_004518, partial [[Pythium] brassicae (nom. inval.)]
MQATGGFDFGVQLLKSMISRKLLKPLCTIKQVRIVPATCDNETNKEKPRIKLLAHKDAGDNVALLDETISILYSTRTHGRAKNGTHAKVAVFVADGLFHYSPMWNSIRKTQNAAFVYAAYTAVTAAP